MAVLGYNSASSAGLEEKDLGSLLPGAAAACPQSRSESVPQCSSVPGLASFSYWASPGAQQYFGKEHLDH